MKTFQLLALLFFVASFSFTSCKSDDDGGDGPSGGSGTMTARVSGDNFTGMDGTVKAVLSSGALAISGGTTESENLQMIILNFDGVGTYPLNFMNIGTYSYLPDQGNIDPTTAVIYATSGNVSGNSGEVNISAYDANGNVEGTFSFTAYGIQNANGTIDIAQGEFNIAVEQQ